MNDSDQVMRRSVAADQAAERTQHAAFEHRWRPSPALPAAITVALIFAALGLVLSRPDLVVLAVPFIAVAGRAWAFRRESTRSQVTITVDETPRTVRDARMLHYAVALATLPDTQTVQVRCTAQEIDRASTTLAAGGVGSTGFTGVIPVLHSGPHEFLRLDYRLVTADGAFVGEPSRLVRVNRVVPAPFTPIGSLPLPHRLQGMTGAHDSARPGDGGEFRDVHPFHPGDRLRRIDWKATARLGRSPGDLYVRRSAATADATVFVMIDSAADVGESVADWPTGTATLTGVTSMDLTRQAAASIAAGYIKAGDQVALQDLTSTTRVVPLGSGSRHLHRVLQTISMTTATGRAVSRLRPPVVTPGALIYLISPFLDDEPARLATLWRGSGHRVIAVDVLPAPHRDRLTLQQRTAHRMISMERNDRLRELTAAGVEVIRFAEDGVPGPWDARLRVLARPRKRSR